MTSARRMTVAAVAAALVSVSASAALPLSEASAAAGKKITFRGMSLTLPSGWTADRIGDDWLQVRPKGCDPTRTACANFAVVGPKVIKGSASLEKYRTNHPFAPGTGVSPCRFTPSSGTFGERFVAGEPLQNDHRRVGRGHRAQYRVWAAECYNMNTGKRTRSFRQREWYLSKPQILIVDGWNISALADIVARATWR